MSSSRDFDPRTRAFSDEDLKPQPMIKKSRKQFVPDEMKDDKYWARRRKNNMAAKRSRDARRMKENQIALRAGYLEKEVLTSVGLLSICVTNAFLPSPSLSLFPL
jgi:leukemia factor-related protein